MKQRISKLAGQLFLCLLAAVISGCQTASYYTQAIHGQAKILAGREPIAKVISRPETAADLKERLEKVLQIREFAEKELHLPVNGQYASYVDLHRRFAVWNVTAAPEFSLQSKAWWYPIVGRLTYRGYFSEPAARRYADSLAKSGLQVYVGGVEAYSTLGWFTDPVLNTFVDHDDADLAQILFHELTHQKLFISGDTDFNEAFATAVADEAVRRWMLAQGNTRAHAEFLRERQREEQFVAMVMGARNELKALYDGKVKSGRVKGADAENVLAEARAQREQIIAKLRKEYARLKEQWGGYGGYDRWMGKPLNNAQLNTVATYYDLVPDFRRLLAANGGDLEKFYRQVAVMKNLSKDQRREMLKNP